MEVHRGRRRRGGTAVRDQPVDGPGLRKDYDGLLALLDTFNRSGELCNKSGMQFGYHNHDFEFSESLNNQTLYDIILQKTDPNW
jgi:hypothetical protein